jgi:glycine cleavage system H protein
MHTTAGFDFPRQRHYDGANHFWARHDEAGRASIGIDRLGLEALGELAYIALPAVGSRIERGDAMGTLEAAKMTTELVAPLSGVVVERNEGLLSDPSPVNTDPYGAGWLVTIEPSDWSGEATQLISGQALEDWVAAEVERYRAEGWID